MGSVMVFATVPARTSRAVVTLRRTVVALLGVLACADNPAAPDQPAPNAPARIVATTISVAGGQSFRQTTQIDSASATYQHQQCRTTPASLSECAEPPQSRTGSVSGQSLQALFARAHAPDFRKLRAEYLREPPRPPDYEATTLVITADERRRTIVWEGGVTVPVALSSFYCQLRVAAGELINCA